MDVTYCFGALSPPGETCFGDAPGVTGPPPPSLPGFADNDLM